VKKSYDLSDQSRPVTPSSLANINEFYTKYNEFERNQLKKTVQTESLNDNNKNNKFNSIAYKTDEFITNNENSNPIIANLIQKAEKLKNEMIKSTTSNCNLEQLSMMLNDKLDSSFNEYIDEHDDYLDFNENATFEHSYLYDNKFDYLKQTRDEDIELNNYEEDNELKELLHPSSLFTRLIETNKQPLQSNSKMLYSRETPQRPYSATNSCYSSEDEEHAKTITQTNNNRNVSFDIQSSSDGESSIASSSNDTDHTDILSPQRLLLLNLVQITRLKIDNIDFYSSFSNNILKSIENNEIEIKKKLQNSKPPRAVKSDLNQSFFIEYQFPVIANKHLNEDNLNNNATQVMRVMPKRLNKAASQDSNLANNKIQFDHNADYSVLFSSKSIENWWKSYIVFKIYLRQQHKTVPQLIGIARLKLRNLLKSRNFKLIKKLAILDHTSSEQTSKRIGTLNVSVELSSDLNEFISELHKLKTHESTNNNNQQTKPIKSISKTSIVSNTKPPVHLEQTNIINKIVETPAEQTIPIDFYLSVSEGREFNNSFKNQIYLICRLFWNKEKIKLEENLNFNWTLNLSFMLKKSLIDNMRNNFMIIEAWVKSNSNNNNNLSSSDSLIGTLKLPLQEFYLKFNDMDRVKHLLNDSITYTQPIIGVNGWISVLDPFSGFKSGELNILLAMGSNKQILNLQKTLFDQSRIKLNKTITPADDFKQHVFTISLEQIKLQPSLDRNQTFDETDYFVKYVFLNGNDLKFNSFIIATKFSSNFNNKQEHKIILKEANKNFISLILNKYKENDFIKFELWKRSYFPNLREKVLAKGEILLEKILNLVIREQKKDSFIVPLILNDSEEDMTRNDKFLGQLFIDIEYKCLEYLQKPDAYSIQNEKQLISNNNDSNILLSIGILRANRLQTLIKNSKNIDNSEIYVKFSSAFINKPLVSFNI